MYFFIFVAPYHTNVTYTTHDALNTPIHSLTNTLSIRREAESFPLVAAVRW